MIPFELHFTKKDDKFKTRSDNSVSEGLIGPAILYKKQSVNISKNE